MKVEHDELASHSALHAEGVALVVDKATPWWSWILAPIDLVTTCPLNQSLPTHILA